MINATVWLNRTSDCRRNGYGQEALSRKFPETCFGLTHMDSLPLIDCHRMAESDIEICSFAGRAFGFEASFAVRNPF